MTPDEVAAWLANPPPRTCPKCKVTKPRDEFNETAPYCKDCTRTYQRSSTQRARRKQQYNTVNRTEMLAYNAQYYEDHKDERRAYEAERYANNPDTRRIHRVSSSTTYAKRRRYQIVEPVDPDVVFERDGGICQVCGEPVDKALHHLEPMAATLDHIAPIHSYATVQLAHRICNTSAGGPRNKVDGA